jgi:hypothetical protein
MCKTRGMILVSCLSVLAACGRGAFPVSTVEGTVAVDGKPVPEGAISFSPLESNTGQPISTEIRDGKYHSTKVPRGRSLVIITAMQDTGEKHVEFGIEYPKLRSIIPEKYRSGIELNVDAPTLKHDFELASQ